jgi:GNAT superfamily N-acetyltransferase
MGQPVTSQKRQVKIPQGFTLRQIVKADMPAVEACIRRIPNFSPKEVAIAIEVFDAAVDGDVEYRVAGLFTEAGAIQAGICFGQGPISQGMYLIYWLFVDPAAQKRGLGRLLVFHAEELIRAENGHMIVIETAGKHSYSNTRAFWERCDFREEARIADYYAPGDAIVFYVKRLNVS